MTALPIAGGGAAREGGLGGEPALVEMEASADAQPLGGERCDFLGAPREIRASLAAVHGGELHIEREVRVDGVDLAVGEREQHEQSTRPDEGADLEDAQRMRFGQACPRRAQLRHEVGRVGGGNRPLLDHGARITERLEGREHPRERVGCVDFR